MTPILPLSLFAASKCLDARMTTVMTGAYRYFRIQKALTVGRFPPARQTLALINGPLMAIIIVTFGVLVGTRQA